MSLVQRIARAVLPRSWFAAMEAESRQWVMRCPCGARQSVWDAGGIRWKAAGKKAVYARCPACGQSAWQPLEKVKAA